MSQYRATSPEVWNYGYSPYEQDSPETYAALVHGITISTANEDDSPLGVSLSQALRALEEQAKTPAEETEE